MKGFSGPVLISVTVRPEGKTLLLRVQDNGRGLPDGREPVAADGIGISNVRGRLEALYGATTSRCTTSTWEAAKRPSRSRWMSPPAGRCAQTRKRSGAKPPSPAFLLSPSAGVPEPADGAGGGPR